MHLLVFNHIGQGQIGLASGSLISWKDRGRRDP